MATQVTQLHQPARRGVSWPWFREFIRWEVAPYPGRASMVARMTIAATLAMLVVVTFRIPNAFLAALLSIIVARENLIATWRGARFVVVGFVVASAYTLLGMILFRGYPLTHFFWVIGSLYLIFFVMRTAANYGSAWAFAIPIGISLPVWDRSVPSQVQVEGTLWPILIIALGAGVSVVTEAIYRIFDSSDPLIKYVDELLLTVQQIAESIACLQAPPAPVKERLLQYNMIGTGRLRMTLQRQGLGPTQRAQRAAMISLAGRLIGLGVDLERNSLKASEDDATRLHTLSERLGVIRTELRESGGVSASPLVLVGPPSTSFTALQEMERTVALFSEVFQGNEVVDGHGDAPERDWWRGLLLPDAFQNPEHQRFALAGCLTATVCYILYNAIDWPGIFICVTTCIVTALSTIGNSLQAQFLRLAGFVAGGLVLGISAQILILPSLDSVFGFALFFAAGTAIAAWFATSSPRLSFFGVQMALSFYFVNLQDSHIQTDLTIARDKVIGVLVGILAMGLIFDRFGTKSDAEQLQKLLARNVRMLAQLAGSPPLRDRATRASQSDRLRYEINDNFAALELQTDAARFEFEFRHRREEDAGECQRIQRVQPGLRSIYLLELSLLSRRDHAEPGSELNQKQDRALGHFLNEYSDALKHVAAWIANEEDAPAHFNDDSMQLLEQTFADPSSPGSRAVIDNCQKMVSALSIVQSEC